MTKLSDQELNLIRQIRIHSILGIQDNGRRISMRCPFHKERTASFTLYPTNDYHCYGCGANGNGAIDFCMALGYEFVQACEELVKYIK